MSLALASKLQVLENYPVLGSRTELFFEMLKVCGAREKFFEKRFFSADRLKNVSEDLFFFFLLALVSLASSISVLGLERSVLSRAVLGLGCFCVLDLGPCVFDSTSDKEVPGNLG